MMTSRLAVSLALFVIALAAVAGGGYVAIEKRLTPTQMQETGLAGLSADQLARLNEILRGDGETQSQAPADRTGEDRGAISYIGMDVERITTRLKGSVSSWEPGTVFELENGQTWKVLKGNLKLRKTLLAPEVVLVPGIAGRWFLQIEEDAPKARVYRID